MCREDGKGPCDRQSVTYNIKFAECNDIYIGETSRSAYTRGKEHIKSLPKKEERSALWKHCKEKHNSEMQKFERQRCRFLLQRRHVEADIGGSSDRSSTGRLVDEL